MQTNSDIPKTEQEHLRIINRSGHHLLSLINAVLDMSKIESGQVELEPVSFDLREQVDDLINMMAATGRKKRIVPACGILLRPSPLYPCRCQQAAPDPAEPAGQCGQLYCGGRRHPAGKQKIRW
ncbi:MAG: hypothetical protein D3922_16065 [Candidatus Electrothrix sp. AR1]|nr:hypothetical protein [Candidatus Electrothrix sp. AR1]